MRIAIVQETRSKETYRRVQVFKWKTQMPEDDTESNYDAYSGDEGWQVDGEYQRQLGIGLTQTAIEVGSEVTET
jgi:hypothetical protein